MRLAAYAGASVALAVGTLVKAFSQRPNFYSATVYLSQSNACLLILTNLALVCTISFIYGMQRLCYGKLRPIEVEQLSEKAWYAVLDTLLAMPSLRDDVGGWLLVVFVLLLASKVWGWIAEGRIDTIEQQQQQTGKLFHIRLTASLAISCLFNALMVHYCIDSVIADPRPGMMMIFAFEFAIQLVFAVFTTARYLLVIFETRIVAAQTAQKISERKAEIRQERLQAMIDSGQDEATLVEPTDADVDENEIDVPGWEEKRAYLFGLELASDCVKLSLYTVFFAISLTFIGLPMHIMRDVYITIANFTKRIQDFSNYRRATQDMNSRYPDATAEELQRENTCIVCRDTMIAWEQGHPNPPAGQPRTRTMNEGLRAKKLPCGHILHLRCLKAWLERQQACPTCRRSVLPPAVQTRDAQGNPRPPADILADAQRAGIQAGQPGPVAPPAAGARQPPQPRPNRMRWLNMGPVRIGLYNGPAAEVQDAIRNRNNTAADGQSGHAQQRAGSTQRCERHLSTEDHLRTVELRLLQQSHNLNVDRAQLATIRALETELARLRALRISSSSNTQSANNAGAAAAAIGAASNVPLPQSLQVQRYQAAPAAAPLMNGNADLPAGLVLPEGWSLVPLQRTAQPIPQQQPVMPGFPLPMMPNLFNAQANVPGSGSASSQSGTSGPAQSQGTSTGPAPAEQASSSTPAVDPATSTAPDAPSSMAATAESAPAGPNDVHDPANDSNASSWSFASVQHASDEAAVANANNSAHRDGDSSENIGSGDRPRTVDIEDVPDAGNA